MYVPTGTAAFIDAEHALDPVYAKNLGVNVDDLLVCQVRLKVKNIPHSSFIREDSSSGRVTYVMHVS